jgi:hypothetical protein
MMRPYQALRVVLYIIAGIEGVAGIVLVFATGWVLSFAPKMPAFPYAAFVVALVKGIGILALAVGYLLCVAARDPVRYVAIVDTLVFILIAAAALNVYAAVALGLGALYPGPYLIARAALQLVLAVVILALRPKNARPAGA